MASLQTLLADAVARHRNHCIDEAQGLYRQVLTSVPNHPDAWHLLGVLTLQQGRPIDGAALIERALLLDSQAPTFHANYGHALHAAGRFADAALAFAAGLNELLRRRQPWSAVGDFAELIRRYSQTERRAATAAIAAALPLPDPIRRHSLLFYLDGDVDHYLSLIDTFLTHPQRFTIPVLHYAYWGMTMQLFRGQAVMGDMKALPRAMFRFHALLTAETVRRYDIPRRLTGFRPVENPTDSPARPLRLAVVTNQMLGDGHQPTVDAFDIARRLQDDHGCEVTIVNTNTMASVAEDGFWPPYHFNAGDYVGVQTIAAQGSRVRMASFPAGRFVAQRLYDMLDWVQQYDPDVVLAVGAANILADLLTAVRPVICLPTSSGPPPSLAHMVLGYADNETGQDWPEDLPTRFRPFVFGFAPPPVGVMRSRADFGLPPGGPVFVTIGNRLDTEVTPDFLTHVDTVLDRLPDALWVMAGGVETLPQRIKKLTHHQRVLALGHVDEVRALFRLCVAYVNPPRQGGGGSASFALADGLPVVTPPTGDVAAVAGADFTVTQDQLVGRCLKLVEDRDFWAAQSAAAKARYVVAGDRGYAIARLLDYCRQAARIQF